MGVSFLYKKDHNYETGTLIGSRVDPDWIKIKQTVDHEPVINTPKCLTFGKYPIAGTDQDLLAISIHGVNAVPLAALKRHLELTREEIQRHDGPVIFAGDFNTNLKSKVNALMKFAADLNLRSLEFRNDARIHVGGQIIDYIFVRGLHPKDAEVLGQLHSSDHKAMLAELAVDEAR
jgi:endonuclease/exonuclease/phosphatase (EEP) superfamily protein YafD